MFIRTILRGKPRLAHCSTPDRIKRVREQPLQPLAKSRNNEYPSQSFPEKLCSLPERRAAAISFSAESSAALASFQDQLAYFLSSLYNPFQ